MKRSKRKKKKQERQRKKPIKNRKKNTKGNKKKKQEAKKRKISRMHTICNYMCYKSYVNCFSFHIICSN